MTMRRVFTVVPAFRVSESIIQVVDGCLRHSDLVIVVDDACPESSGGFAKAHFKSNSAVLVLENAHNLGVGGAVKRGMKEGFDRGFDVGVKVDGDGQIEPSLIPSLLEVMDQGNYDCVKGNRFSRPEDFEQMPAIRLLGNLGLSVLSKLSSGYWRLNDPTNGFIALSSKTYSKLRMEKIANDYFFESDLLFRLGLINARIGELGMTAVYGEEKSSLRPLRSIPRFLLGNLKNGLKRLVYDYFIKEWNQGTISLLAGSFLSTYGLVQALSISIESTGRSTPTPAGTLFVAAVPIIVGIQLLLNFSFYDTTKRNGS